MVFGIPEERELEPGTALSERRELIRDHEAINLGPLDLCFVSKTGTDGLLGKITAGSSEIGFYHRVAGSDVSSVAAIAAYFADLVQRQGESSVWDEGGSMKIVGGVFCVWNPFCFVDLHVEFSCPGDVDFACFTRDGRQLLDDIPDTFWDEIRLASALRALSAIQNRGLHVHLSGPSRILDPLEGTTAVAALTALAGAHMDVAGATGCPSKYIHASEVPLQATWRL